MEAKTFVVIGGTSGLGLETAQILKGRGHRVVVIGNETSEVEETARVLECDGLVCDVSHYDLLDQTLQQIFTTMGPVAGVVNCAAIWVHAGLFHELAPSVLYKSTEVNFLGTTYVAHATIKYMLEQGGGNLVLVAAMAAIRPGPDIALYAAQKAGVRQLGLSLAQRYGPQGIKVSVVHPGGMLTELQRRVGAEYTDPVFADTCDVAEVVVDRLLDTGPLIVTDVQVVHKDGKW